MAQAFLNIVLYLKRSFTVLRYRTILRNIGTPLYYPCIYKIKWRKDYIQYMHTYKIVYLYENYINYVLAKFVKQQHQTKRTCPWRRKFDCHGFIAGNGNTLFRCDSILYGEKCVAFFVWAFWFLCDVFFLALTFLPFPYVDST